jgi:hypothetical protein
MECFVSWCVAVEVVVVVDEYLCVPIVREFAVVQRGGECFGLCV